MTRLILIELNEVNFEFIQAYAAQGHLPRLGGLIERHGLGETTSEKDYADLEPWIQWVTAHTGLSLAEHGVFRLGDIVDRDISQIWEELEGEGFKVGAVSPMNAKNRTTNASFFLPDPWTSTRIDASPVLRKMHEAIGQIVNDNAQAKLTLRSVFWLLVGAAFTARPKNYSKYLELAANAPKKPWLKALVLDVLLADTFVGLLKRTRPDFASIFLNAAAHIQHHYMFSSPLYNGGLENPEWYVAKGHDPLLDVYRAYDRIVGQIEDAMPQARLMIATGLHQTAYPDLTIYWRLRDHARFLERIGVPFDTVEPRMSRDFLVRCCSGQEAATAEARLSSVFAADGVPLFGIDNRGTDLFVSLTYPKDVPGDLTFNVGNQNFGLLKPYVAFVAIKNGEHDGIGYFLDTRATSASDKVSFPLKNLPGRIRTAMAEASP